MPNKDFEFTEASLKLFGLLKYTSADFRDTATLLAKTVTLGASGYTTLTPVQMAQVSFYYIMSNAGITVKDADPKAFQAKLDEMYASYANYFGTLQVYPIPFKKTDGTNMTLQEIAPRDVAKDVANCYSKIDFFKRDDLAIKRNALFLSYGIIRNLARRSNKKNISFIACHRDYGYSYCPSNEFTDRMNEEAADLSASVAVLATCAENIIISSGTFIKVGAEIGVHLVVRLAWAKMAVVANAVKVCKARKISVSSLADYTLINAIRPSCV